MELLKKYRHRINETAGADYSSPVEGWQASPDGVVVACLHKPNRLRHIIVQPIYWVLARYYVLIQRALKPPAVGADYSPPVEGCQASPDGVVVACLHKPNRLRHIIVQPIYWVLARYYVLIQRALKPPAVGTDYSPPVEGWQASPDGVVVACLHKPNRLRHIIVQPIYWVLARYWVFIQHALKPPAVGADYSPPVEGWQASPDGVVVACLHKPNRLRHIIVQPIYWVLARYYVLIQRALKPPAVGADYSPPVEGWQASPDGVVVACLHKPNRLRHIIVQPIYWVLARYWVFIQHALKPPAVGADYSPPVEGWQASPDGVVVACLHKPNRLRHIIVQPIYWVLARYYVLIQRALKPPAVGADYSPPVEGWQASPDGVVVACLHKPNRLRHIIVQPIYWVLARYWVFIQRALKPPAVGADYSPPVEGWQASPDGVVVACLHKPNRLRHIIVQPIYWVLAQYYVLIQRALKPPAVGADYSPPVEGWQALPDGVVVACLHKPNRLRHIIVQPIYWVLARYYVLIQRALKPPAVGADYSPPVEGWQASPDGVVVACLHKPNRLRHIIVQPIYWVLAQYYVLIQRALKPPAVGADYSPPVEGWQASPDGVVVACLHKPNRLRHIIVQPIYWVLARYYVLIQRALKPPAVGADYSPPVEGCQASPDGVVVACLHKPNRLRHIIVQPIYWVLAQYYVLIQRALKPPAVGADYSPPVEGWQASPDGVVVACLHKPNRLRHIIVQPIYWVLARYWVFIKRVPKPLHMLGTCAISIAARHQIMVSINQMAQPVLHNVTPFVAVAQTAVLFFNNLMLAWRLI